MKAESALNHNEWATAIDAYEKAPCDLPQTVSNTQGHTELQRKKKEAETRLTNVKDQATYLKTPSPIPNDLKAVDNALYASLSGLASGSRKAQEQQKEWVKKLNLPLEVETKKAGIRLRLIPPGTFMMGSQNSEDNRDSNETQHQVTFTQPFYCSKFEINQRQWKKIMGENPSKFKNVGDNVPVEQVSWEDCQKFLNKLCELEGVPRGTYCLLTETPWEYACRAGTSTVFCYGDSLDSSMANFNGDTSKGVYRSKTTPVGSFKPNAWGLYDMHGNVWEWCRNRYGGEYGSGSVTDPSRVLSGSNRICRGGSWYNFAISCRSAKRSRTCPASRFRILGFRIMRIVPK
jgi:formylglycine-generating enzyme required for sulfatase activity